MSQRSKITTSQSLKGQIYFGIIPQKIKQTSTTQSQLTNKWILYLQKGMQIIGKTTIFQISSQNGQYIFEAQKNKFDFQIVVQKNFGYTWSLYKIDDQGYQQRITSQNFNIKEYFNKYQSQFNKSGYDLIINFRNNFILEFKLFIQNTANCIIGLANWVVPQGQEQIAKALIGIVKRGNSQINVNGIINKKQKQSSNISIQQDKDAKKAKQSQIIQTNNNNNNNKNQQQLQQKQSHPYPQDNKQLQQKQIQQQSKKIQILSNNNNNNSYSPTMKIQQQSQQDSIVSDKNRSQTKVLTQNRLDTQVLSSILEDKQKQDLITPMANQSKFRKPGSINQAIGQAVYKNKGVDGNQEIIQRIEEVEVQGGSPVRYQTPQGQGQEQKVEVQTQTQTKGGKPYNLKQVPEIQTVPVQSGNKFKKLIIIVLIFILVAGIIGALISPKEQQQDQHKRKTKPKKKVIKKGKNKQ